ncbi:unnamed protein product [Gordionus sp. m RMFG-2023]
MYSGIIPFHSFDQISFASHLTLLRHHTIPFIQPNPICLPFAHYHLSSSQSHIIAKSHSNITNHSSSSKSHSHHHL